MKNIALLTLILSFNQIVQADDKPFTITVKKNNFAYVQIDGQPPQQQSNSDPISIKINGEENSSCTSYGRKSSAEATASTEIIEQSLSSLSLFLKTDVFATGGHYRNCVTCVAGQCVGILGHDTNARASAVAESIVKIEFGMDYPETKYLLQISTKNTNVKPLLKLTDGYGNEIAIGSLSSEPQNITGKRGLAYYLSVRLPAQATDEGGCCQDIKNSSAMVDVRLFKAPILDGKSNLQPYIIGGDETTSYNNVGAILINGKLHCSGTVIGFKTILTAAHCLHGFEEQIENMSFLIGSNLFQPEFGPISIDSFIYPQKNEDGYIYNPVTLEDDIGLVYLKESINNIDINPLHKGTPTWNEILEKKKNLIFVGFGYDMVNNKPVGSGIKREGAWHINEIENRRVNFSIPKKNTCKGDSGGPAFIRTEDSLIQVGITSGGNTTCTKGFETRIDAFSSWLKGKVF